MDFSLFEKHSTLLCYAVCCKIKRIKTVVLFAKICTIQYWISLLFRLAFVTRQVTGLNCCWALQKRTLSLTLSVCSVHVCDHRSTLVSLHQVRMPWAVLRCRVTLFPWSSFHLVSQLPGESHIPQWLIYCIYFGFSSRVYLPFFFFFFLFLFNFTTLFVL